MLVCVSQADISLRANMSGSSFKRNREKGLWGKRREKGEGRIRLFDFIPSHLEATRCFVIPTDRSKATHSKPVKKFLSQVLR